MSVTKTYQELTEIPKAQIGQCSGVLPNHMQCWRAADIQVNTTDTSSEPPSITSYQLCRRHAIADKQQYDTEVQAVADAAK